MYLFVAVVLNLFNVLCLFGFVLINCGSGSKGSNKVPLVQQTPVPAATDQPTSVVTSIKTQEGKGSADKKQQQPQIPPSNVPVASPKPNDHTMKEVESLKMEGSRE